MRTTPNTAKVLEWLLSLPPSVWWHLGETALWLQGRPGELLKPPDVPGLKVKWLGQDDNLQIPQ